MDQVIGNGATLFWVGVPPVADAGRYQDRYRLIDEIVGKRRSTRGQGRVRRHVQALGRPDGGYTGPS